jgi:transcriptional regulator with XRE-family HTH domain
MHPKEGHMPDSARRATSVDQHVGKRIRVARLAANISQDRLADACGVSFQQVQKYEKGINRVGAGRLLVIAKVLGVDVPYFFDGVPSQSVRGKSGRRTASPPRDIIGTVLASPLGMRLNKAFAQLDDTKAQHRVVELVEQMVARRNGAATDALAGSS